MGQMGANLGNSNVTNPQQAQWGDLDSSEKGARLIAGASRGAGRSMMQPQPMQSQGGGAVPIPMAQQPQVQLPGQQPKSAFYGAY